MTAPVIARPQAADQNERLLLGRVLVRSGLLTEADLSHALMVQRADGGVRRLGEVLRELELVTEADLAFGLASSHQLPLVQLDLVAIDPEVARTVPRAVAERSAVLLYARRGHRLVVAVADPVDIVALDDIRALTGVTGLDVGVATASQIRAAIRAAWAESDESEVFREFVHEVTVVATVEDEEQDDGADASTIRLVDRLIGHAARLHASDIHIEPQRDSVRIRLRVDGVLREIMSLPRSGYSAITARIKIITALDVIERRLPQDGRARVRVDRELVDIRVSTLPSLHGEKVVIRLLPASTRLPSLTALGLEPEQRSLLMEITSRPQGMVLLTGPTGSGKTNTLYAAIAEGVFSDRNVITLEDPVEIELPGITQVPIDHRSGMGFTSGLRAALRQDPDVLLVGEIRDQDTAELAVRAALTGHLVLSTLHTLDAASAVTRLVDMGVPAYLVASSLALVVSQRLVRVPCRECRAHDTPAPELLLGLGVTDPSGDWVRAVGCHACAGTGYRGRTAVIEMLETSPIVRRALVEHNGEEGVRRAVRDTGTPSLLDHAIRIARRGDTTLAEVLRAVPNDTGHVLGVDS